MSPEELKLQCLGLAMDQARREATTDLNRVAELHTWFYNRIAIAPATEPEKVDGRRKKAVDKSGDPFA
jgi:hypothetical protein